MQMVPQIEVANGYLSHKGEHSRLERQDFRLVAEPLSTRRRLVENN
jgi:hypothetical protein